MDRREVTLEVVDATLASDATWRNLEEFGARMRDVLTDDDRTRFDSARWLLRNKFGIAVTATRDVFAKD